MCTAKDEMTSKERMKAYFSNEQVDRLPFSVYLGEPSAKFLDINTRDYYHNSSYMVDTEKFCYDRFGHDGVSIRTGLHGFAEAMGTTLNFPKNGLATVETPFLSSPKNYNNLTIANPNKDGRLPIFLKGLEMLQEKLGDEVGVSASIPGPFTTLSSLRGTEQLMKDLYGNSEKVHEWLTIINKTIISYIDEALKLGVGVSFSEPMGSCSLISSKMFREFVKPYLKECSDNIFTQTAKRPSLHICGKTEKIFKDMIEIGISSLSLDNVVDMKRAKEEVGKDVCLVGNVRPVDTILNGSREDIFDEVKSLVELLHDNQKGYIISPGCQLPMPITLEKVDIYVEAAKTFGKYPIKL